MSVNQLTNVFGGFAPFPNTIATALLAYQSEAIGFGFGIKFQYAKRLIGAMTNEEFNLLTPSTIGNIIESHNTELINRMKSEMPKWLDIQLHFIEASVSIEIAKANRTPSAMAEIFTAFVKATGDLVGDDPLTIDNFAEKWNQFFGGNQIFTPDSTTSPPPPPPPDDPSEDPEHLHEDPLQHEFPESTNGHINTAFIITEPDPISGGSKTWTSQTTNLSSHVSKYRELVIDRTPVMNQTGGSNSWASTVVATYKSKIQSFYGVVIL